ncbi:MAG: N-acetylmuramoyl-L-alanine amidase [Clostridiales bacterium]|nr:N-acetylmuramoyl-L-alanine amidase [Clostridiales bacterium]
MVETIKKSVIFLVILSFAVGFILPVNADNEKIIVLDPGHGGTDNGTSGSMNGTTYYEKNLNLKVARFLWESLAEYSGIKVYMTRYDDTKLSVLSRSKFAADLKADLLVSLHMNALENADYFGGSEIFVPKGNYRPELAEEASAIANKILTKFEALGMKKIGVKTSLLDHDNYYDYPNGAQADYYGINRYCVMENIPSMIIEHGYLSNKNDLTFLSKDDNLRKLADATAQSIAEKYGLSKGSGSKITLQKQNAVTIANLPTSLTVGDQPITLSASGGSGNGMMRFESNDKNVLQIVGNQLVIVGAGKANITAVKGTDGTYAPMLSENYIRITVNDSGSAIITAKPTSTPSFEPTTADPQPTDKQSENPVTKAATPTGNETPATTSKINFPSDNDDTLFIIIAIAGGILAALVTAIIIRMIVVQRRRKNSRNRRYKSGPGSRSQRNQRR